MNMIQQHAEQNAQNAKKVIVKSVTKIIAKHTQYQQELNSLLAGGGNDVTKGANRLITKMAKIEGRVGQFAQTYRIMFGEQLCINCITSKVAKKHYPLIHAERLKNTARRDTRKGSEDVKNLTEIIKASLVKAGMDNKGDFDVKVLDMTEMTEGLSPADFNSFEEFSDAVRAAKKANSSTESGEKTIKNSIIKDAEIKVSKSPKTPKDKPNTNLN